MKIKTTQKEVKRNFHTILKVGYCELQDLLNYKSPMAYTVRAEGWASDVYDIGGGYAVSTGYAPFGNITIPYKISKALEEKAALILRNASNPAAELEVLIDELKEWGC